MKYPDMAQTGGSGSVRYLHVVGSHEKNRHWIRRQAGSQLRQGWTPVGAQRPTSETSSSESVLVRYLQQSYTAARLSAYPHVLLAGVLRCKVNDLFEE